MAQARAKLLDHVAESAAVASELRDRTPGFVVAGCVGLEKEVIASLVRDA
jgi:hypothetical protein